MVPYSLISLVLIDVDCMTKYLGRSSFSKLNRSERPRSPPSERQVQPLAPVELGSLRNSAACKRLHSTVLYRANESLSNDTNLSWSRLNRHVAIKLLISELLPAALTVQTLHYLAYGPTSYLGKDHVTQSLHTVI